MWDNNSNAGGFDAGYGGGDGGFMNQSSNFDTPGKAAAKKVVRGNQKLASVAIKTLLDNSADTLMIEGFEISMIKVVAIVRKVDETSTKVSYVLDDHTGLLDAVKFLEDNDDDSEQGSAMAEGQYVRAIGSLRMMQGKPSLLCFKISQLEDPNIITSHILEVIQQRLKFKQLQDKPTNGAGPVPVLDNSSIKEQTPVPGAGGSFGGAPHEMVYQAIGSFKDVAGVSKGMMASALEGKLSSNDIMNAIKHLLEEGLIYSSTDEDHYLVIG